MAYRARARQFGCSDVLPFASRVNRQVNWHAPPQPRAADAALSVALTAALFGVLNEARPHHVETRTPTVTVWLPPVDPAEHLPAITFKAPDRGSKSLGKSIAVPNRSIQAPLSSNRVTPPESPQSSTRAQSASAPLQLELPKSFAREAKSVIRSMAERSHTYIGDTLASEQERWSRSVERAGKPDCLAPNEHGSLLSVFILAYDAAREKCR
jgi:hypothetical protein